MIVCDDNNICDTTLVIVTIEPVICGDLFAGLADTVSLRTNDCEDGAELCIEIPLAEFSNYILRDNQEIYSGYTWGCEYDSLVTFSSFTFPSQGQVGPYVLENWSINGEVHSTTFMTINDLVDSMNVWDTNSNWTFNATAFLIAGGNPANDYGSLSLSLIHISEPTRPY